MQLVKKRFDPLTLAFIWLNLTRLYFRRFILILRIEHKLGEDAWRRIAQLPYGLIYPQPVYANEELNLMWEYRFLCEQIMELELLLEFKFAS